MKTESDIQVGNVAALGLSSNPSKQAWQRWADRLAFDPLCAEHLLEVGGDLIYGTEARRFLRRLRNQPDLDLQRAPFADGHRHVHITINVAGALIDLYRHTHDSTLLERAAQDLRGSADGLPAGLRRLHMLANLAAALHELHQHTGRLAVLDEAIAAQDELLAPPNPRLPERILNLGVSLLSRYRRRRSDADLERALVLLGEAAESTSWVERASALNSQANALLLRFDDSGEAADLDRAVRLREEAVATAAPGSLDAAIYRGNLGVDLLRRYEIIGHEDDLQRAVNEQRQALVGAPAGSAADPALLAGLADSLSSLATRTRRAEDVAAARTAFARAVDAGRVSRPEQAFGVAMRWGAWESRQRCWSHAADAYDLGLDAMSGLVGRQQAREDKESWLRDAENLPAATAFAHARAGGARRAVVAMEHGRAMLLAEALQGQRLVPR